MTVQDLLIPLAVQIANSPVIDTYRAGAALQAKVATSTTSQIVNSPSLNTCRALAALNADIRVRDQLTEPARFIATHGMKTGWPTSFKLPTAAKGILPSHDQIQLDRYFMEAARSFYAHHPVSMHQFCE